MGNLNVAVIGRPGLGGEIGKKGTSSDITFYNLKRDDATVTLIEPTKYPERLAPLFYSISIARMAIVAAERLDPTFGECALMLDSAGVKEGFIITSDEMKGKVIQLVKGTALENYELFDGDKNLLREKLLGIAKGLNADGKGEAGSVAVDHSFNVKGTGTVVLGTVMHGTVRRHDSLKALPGEKVAQVRSIQKHDDEFEFASEGDRVGLALKGVEPEEVGRGCILTNDTSMRTAKEVVAEAEIHKYWTKPLDAGTVVHIGHWMQFVPGKIEKVETGNEGWRKAVLRISLGRGVAFMPGASGVLMQLEGGKLRVAGRVRLS